MLNPLSQTVSRIKDAIWKYQFNRTPIENLGVLKVKYFKGAFYCVGIDHVRVNVINLLETLPRDGQYGPVLQAIRVLNGPSHVR